MSQPNGGTERGRNVLDREEAERLIVTGAFSPGPPRFVGAELEYTVHHAGSPLSRLDLTVLRAALGDHAPAALDPASPQAPLPSGGRVTLEPGGQVEISSEPHRGLRELAAAVDADLDRLTGLLAARGLRLGHRGLDRRPPEVLVRSPRYDAMAHAFTGHGPHGRTMMGGSAGLQVCLDAGLPGDVTARWQAAHDVGPVLLALFSTSGHPDAQACRRMYTWLRMDARRTHPVRGHPDPAVAWARYALRADVVCVRRDGRSWRAPTGMSFADWLDGALTPGPTVDDLAYHLSTLFPPVRPRGYLELRYLDTQPPAQWLGAAATVVALFGRQSTVDKLREVCQPVADRWLPAAVTGLADPGLARAATEVVTLACQNLPDTGLPPRYRDRVAAIAEARLAAARDGAVGG